MWNKKKSVVVLAVVTYITISLLLNNQALAQRLPRVQVNPVGSITPLQNALTNTQMIVSSSSHDIWVSGEAGGQLVFEHYDGHAWSISYPPKADSSAYINGMAEPNIYTVYAMGYDAVYVHDPSLRSLLSPAIFEWSNGVWTRTSMPLPDDFVASTYSSLFRSIAAVSSWDIWVGGTYGDANENPHALLEHYDGHKWGIVQTPANFTEITSLKRQGNTSTVLALGNDGTATQVLSLKPTKVQVNQVGSIAPIPRDATDQFGQTMYEQTIVSSSSHDIWVGNTYTSCGMYQSNGSCQVSQWRVVFEHYDGHKWSVNYQPGSGDFGYLYGIAEPNTNTVYAVGQYAKGLDIPPEFSPDILQWSKGVWTRIAVPLPSDYAYGGSYGGNGFYSVVAISSQDIWVGGQYTDLNNHHQHALLEHYNGSSWSIVQVPSSFVQISSLQRVGDMSTVLALGNDGTTAQVLSLNV